MTGMIAKLDNELSSLREEITLLQRERRKLLQLLMSSVWEQGDRNDLAIVDARLDELNRQASQIETSMEILRDGVGE